MKQEWSLLDPMVGLFEKIEEGVELAEAVNTPILGIKEVNISYLLILRTGVTGKNLGALGRHAGWPKELAGLQGPFFASLQALPDPQK